MDRSKKEALVAELHETFESASLVVVTSQSGLTVAEVSDLRQKMRDVGAGYKVTKNTLVRLALKGTKFEHLNEVFTGPTAIAFSKDPVAAAKVVTDYQKTNEKISIVGRIAGQACGTYSDPSHTDCWRASGTWWSVGARVRSVWEFKLRSGSGQSRVNTTALGVN